MSTGPADVEVLSEPLTLPNGRVITNRLVKVAMDEGIGYGGGLPDQRHRRLYRRWAEGGWGIIITGNVQVDPRFLATPHCRTFSPDVDLSVKAYSKLRVGALVDPGPVACKPIMLLQLSHPGIQSPATYTFARWPWVPAVGPCSARPDTGSSLLGRLMGQVLWPRKSREIIDFDEWLEIVDQFVQGAKVAEEAGWDGVQIHSAHGYLVASYLSPHTNSFPKPLPGVPWWIPLRLHLLWLILDGIHKSTSASFIKAVKINSSDFVQGGLDEDQSTEIIKEVASWQRIDILEVSGGSYSHPVFGEMTTRKGSGSNRQSLFAHFTANLLPQLSPPPKGPAVLLTGGLHSRRLAADSVRHACHLAGVGRPACLHPRLPVDLFLNPEASDEAADVGGYVMPGAETMKWVLGGGTSKSTRPKGGNEEAEPLLKSANNRSAGIPLVGAGVSTLWHEWQLCRMGRGAEPDPNMNWLFGGFLGEGVWWGMLGGGPLGWCRSWVRAKTD